MDEFYHPAVHALEALKDGEPRTLKQLLFDGVQEESLSALCDYSLVSEINLQKFIERSYRITRYGILYLGLIEVFIRKD